jgi:CDGSH-type Zn-finger protein
MHSLLIAAADTQCTSAMDVDAGEAYWWCACDQSKSQPFCDGSHKGFEFAPVKFEATESKTVWFCACEHTAHRPMCDGTHKSR